MAREASMAKPKFNFDDISTTGENVDAFFTLTPGETVINFGDLTTTGDLANGIFAVAPTRSFRYGHHRPERKCPRRRDRSSVTAKRL
jgi:hypothetical protein